MLRYVIKSSLRCVDKTMLVGGKAKQILILSNAQCICFFLCFGYNTFSIYFVRVAYTLTVQ